MTLNQDRLFSSMLIASVLLHGAFCLATLLADESDAVPLALQRGSVSIRLVARRVPPEEETPPTPESQVKPVEQTEPTPPGAPTPEPPPPPTPAETLIPVRRPAEPPPPTPQESKKHERAERPLPDVVRTEIDIEADADLTVLRPEGADVEQHARARFNPLPPHPVSSRGRVLLLVRVGIDGKPEWARVRQSSGVSRADEMAREFVARVWRFEPARRRGEAVVQEIEILVNFQ